MSPRPLLHVPARDAPLDRGLDHVLPIGRRVGDHAPLGHHGDVVADLRRDAQVVRDEEHREVHAAADFDLIIVHCYHFFAHRADGEDR